MSGVREDLDLKPFHGATLTQICIGEFDLQFRFTHPHLQISVEGDWKVVNPAGTLIDRSLPNGDRDSYRIHRLLGRTVVDHEVSAPESFSLKFDNGWQFVVFDTSEEFESFSIQPANIFV